MAMFFLFLRSVISGTGSSPLSVQRESDIGTSSTRLVLNHINKSELSLNTTERSVLQGIAVFRH